MANISLSLFQIISFHLSRDFLGFFSHLEGFSAVGWTAKGPTLSTRANVNTAIPFQLETLNALDSVHHQVCRSAQLMQPWSLLAAVDGWDG